MIRSYQKTNTVLDLRFAFSPLLELTGSYRLLRYQKCDARYHQWIHETQAAIADLHLPYMDTVLMVKYIPDFLTPSPLTIVHHIEEAFRDLMKTPPHIIRENIHTLNCEYDRAGEPGYGWKIRQHFIQSPYEALEILIAEMRDYWKHALADHWHRIQHVLENDIRRRARHLALDGADSMLQHVDSRLHYSDGNLRIVYDDTPHKHHKPDLIQDVYCLYDSTTGINMQDSILQFVPFLFGHGAIHYQFSPHWRPMLMYTPDGTGLWYSSPEPDDRLEMAVGAARARLLVSLLQPATTGELAIRLSLTAGAVSQQLSRLSQAELVESERIGKQVHYRLSQTGRKLLSLF